MLVNKLTATRCPSLPPCKPAGAGAASVPGGDPAWRGRQR